MAYPTVAPQPIARHEATLANFTEGAYPETRSTQWGTKFYTGTANAVQVQTLKDEFSELPANSYPTSNVFSTHVFQSADVNGFAQSFTPSARYQVKGMPGDPTFTLSETPMLMTAGVIITSSMPAATEAVPGMVAVPYSGGMIVPASVASSFNCTAANKRLMSMAAMQSNGVNAESVQNASTCAMPFTAPPAGLAASVYEQRGKLCPGSIMDGLHVFDTPEPQMVQQDIGMFVNRAAGNEVAANGGPINNSATQFQASAPSVRGTGAPFGASVMRQ